MRRRTSSNSDGLELRVDLADALDERRVGREGAADALGEQHVRDFLGVGVRESRAGAERADLLQRAAQSLRSRVNCTAEASASYSRWRDTAAWISRPKNRPI